MTYEERRTVVRDEDPVTPSRPPPREVVRDVRVTTRAPSPAPFEGILRTNALSGSGSTLDVTAIVALVGWAILELVVLALVRIGRREP